MRNGELVTSYAGSLYTDAEAVQEPCTRRGGIFSAAICAGFMVSAFIREVGMGEEMPKDSMVSLQTMTMFGMPVSHLQ